MNLSIVQNAPFQASWNQSNVHLKAESDWLVCRLAMKIVNLIFYIPKTIVAAIINPRPRSVHEESPVLEKNFGKFNKEIITPDQVHLAAQVELVEGATSSTRTAILHNPLGCNHFIHLQLKQKLLEKGCNVITFDYRGFTETWREKDLFVDAESVYQYATAELGVEKDQIQLFGYSLGGFVAANVKALHPGTKGRFVADRSLRSVYHFLKESVCITCLGSLVKKITSVVAEIFIAFPIYLLGWSSDAVASLRKVKCEKRIYYHPNDWLIPFETNIASASPEEEVYPLNSKDAGFSSHSTPIGGQLTDEGNFAVDEVASFLAGKSFSPLAERVELSVHKEGEEGSDSDQRG